MDEYRQPVSVDEVIPMEAEPVMQAIGTDQIHRFNDILQKYKAGKARTEDRIIADEQWWKLQNWEQMGRDGGSTRYTSGWLHNVIVSKQADAIAAYPEPNLLPREPADREEATVLSSIVPCILEQNDFESTYSDASWQKLKSGTSVYQILWDSSKLNGPGDISIEKVDVLNVFWEPGVSDIQKGQYFFRTYLEDKDVLKQQFPNITNLTDSGFKAKKFVYDDAVDTTDKVTVVEVYYHKWNGPRKVLHYCKYVGDNVLYATENMTTAENGQEPLATRGLYDHGLYPFVFDALFPIEGSPCGYGFVELCKSPQEQIDILGQAFITNAVWASRPRYFYRQDGSINEEEFLDSTKSLVHCPGNLGEDSIRQIVVSPLDDLYVTLQNNIIQSLRETSGNTETATGSTASGVTAASAIAALQEASGKGSRAASKSAYRAFSSLVGIVIELIRQFYDMPRQFRIIGDDGAMQFIQYTNARLQKQYQGNYLGTDLGYRLPVFDIVVSAQKESEYTKISQNELMLQLYQLGCFNPEMAAQSCMMLENMDFKGKDELLQKVRQNGDLYQQMMLWEQMAVQLAAKYEPGMAQGLAEKAGVQMPVIGGQAPDLKESDAMQGQQKDEHAFVEKARQQSQEAGQPDGGNVIAERKPK